MNLSDDSWQHILREYVGWGNYRYVAGTCRKFRNRYGGHDKQEQQENKHQSNNTSSENAAGLRALGTTNLAYRRRWCQTSMTSAAESMSKALLYLNELDDRYTGCQNADSCSEIEQKKQRLQQKNFQLKCLTQAAAFCGKRDILDYCLQLRAQRVLAQECSQEKGNAKSRRIEYDSGLDWSTSVICAAAAKGGQLDILKHAIQVWCCDWDAETCAEAAECGHFRILKWAKSQGCSWNWKTCAGAAKGGHLEILKWARQSESTLRLLVDDEDTDRPLQSPCDWNSHTCANAAWNGHWELLEWALEKGCPRDELTTAYVARTGNLERLQRLRGGKVRCPWNELVCRYASEHGHLHVLKWARENGCDWNQRACLSIAAAKPHSRVVEWIEQQHCDSGESLMY